MLEPAELEGDPIDNLAAIPATLQGVDPLEHAELQRIQELISAPNKELADPTLWRRKRARTLRPDLSDNKKNQCIEASQPRR
jgi:hypothetical protein